MIQAVDLAAVGRDGGEALGPDELTAAGEVVAGGAEAAAGGGGIVLPAGRPAVVELAQPRRLAGGEHQPAGGHVEAGHDALAADEQSRLAGAVGRDAVDVHAAVVLGDEHEAVAVPERLAHARVRCCS